jgi:hypothetical protein
VITLSKTTISAGAPFGAAIGTFNPSNVQLQSQSTPNGVAYFAVKSGQLVAAWSYKPIIGTYTIQVHAPGSGTPAKFTITITAEPDLSLTINPPTATVASDALAGLVLAQVKAVTSDGSPFNGFLGVSDPMSLFAISKGNIILSRALAASDDGSHSGTITATLGAQVKTMPFTVTVMSPPVPVIMVMLNGATLLDNAPAGTVVGTYHVTMSDGSPFTGTVSISE